MLTLLLIATLALTADDAAAQALVASPALQALDRALEAAEARTRAAAAWPNPSLVSQVQLSPNAANNMVTVGFRQPLDFRDLAGLRRRHAATDVEAVKLQRERLRRTVAHEARARYIHLWRDETVREAHNRHVTFLVAEQARAQQRVVAGALAPHETLHVAYEVARARLEAEAAAHEAERERARLNFLWGRPAHTAILLPATPAARPELEASLEVLVAEALTRRLEPAEVQIAVSRERRAAQLAEALRFGEGDIDVQGGTAANTDPLLYGGFTLPLPVWDDQTDRAAAARAEGARLEAERVGIERAIAQEVADAHLACRHAAQTLRTASEVLLPLADHAVERAEARVKAGAGSREELLEARKLRLDAATAGIQAVLDREQAYLTLDQALGR